MTCLLGSDFFPKSSAGRNRNFLKRFLEVFIFSENRAAERTREEIKRKRNYRARQFRPDGPVDKSDC
ncbi:hypothetical protein ACM25N_01055 [Roseovarius sp. C7]|uniref:hypothetical protein n=1 Tax=Roseovarius TaxID=74030 RepID=UPI0030EBDBF6